MSRTKQAKTRLHFIDEEDRGAHISRPICGELGAAVTTYSELVTCKRCRKLLRKREQQRHPAEIYQELTEELFDDLEGLPMLTPATWRRRDCGCGTCAICRFFMRLRQDEFSRPNRKRHGRRRRAQWSSVTKALEEYVATREDGFSSGGWGYSLDAMRRLGMRVQSDGPTDSTAQRQADSVVDIEHALKGAFDGSNDRGLGTEWCLKILFARVVGRLETVDGAYGTKGQQRVPIPEEDIAKELCISVAMVRAIVKSGRRRIHDHLQERGLVEPLRSRAA